MPPSLRAALKSAAGPLVMGAAAWCAAGTVTVASAAATTPRVAVAAPWWVFAAAAALAAMVPAWRRDARLALPALVSTIPWWPVPLPALGLLWTGPLAWVPIGVAAAAAVGAAPLRHLGRALGADRPARATALAALLVMTAASLTAWSAAPVTPAGDEPHYLVITQSLLEDHDLQIEKVHQRRAYTAYYHGELRPDYIARGTNGQIYSIHAPGVAALVLPAFAAGGYTGARAFLILLAGLAAALVWRIGWRVTESEQAAWFGCAALVCCPTFLFHAFEVFPDGPGLLGVAVVLSTIVVLARGESISVTRLALTGAVLAALPWLHTRFALLSIALGLVIVLRIGRQRGAAARRLAALLALPLLSAVAWFTFFHVIYGTFNPFAPYGGAYQPRPWFVNAFVGLLFDQQFGLFTYAPALAACLVGWTRRTPVFTRRLAAELGAVALVYLVAVCLYWMWWAGAPATPARFATAVLPILAVGAAVAWRTASARGRAVLLALLAIAAALSTLVVAVDHTALAWNDRNAQANWLVWLGPLVNLPRAWPSFFWFPDHEGRFTLQWLVWVAVFVGVWGVVRRAWPGARDTRLAVACWLVAGTTLAAQTGWWLADAPALDPAASQLAELRAQAAGGRHLEIGPWAIHHRAGVPEGMVIAPPSAGVTDTPPPTLALQDVPAGVYRLHVHLRLVTPLTLALTLGDAPRPLRTLAVQPTSDQSFLVTLPARTSSLVADAGADARRAVGAVTLEPVALVASVAGRIRAAMRYGDSDVYLLDDGAFAEAGGFWVQGRGATRVAIDAPRGQPTLRLALRNGAAPNDVMVETGSFRQSLRLAPGQTAEVALPAAAGEGMLTDVRITSRDGFRPSAVDPHSFDDRLLGVWVEVR